jgi:hypothetical protein
LITLACLCLGCEVASLAEDAWPCSGSRPCATGWACVQNVCIQGTGSSQPDTTGADTGAPEGYAGAQPDVPVVVPPAIWRVTVSFSAPGLRPRGLAIAPDGLWIGDEATR